MIQTTRAARIETKVRPRPATGIAKTYLYGVLEGGPKACPRAVGVDGESPLRLLSYDGLKAVVSDYQGPAFGALPREQLVGCLLAHQRVTEGFLAAQAVLPVKFGTLLDDPQEALALLSQGHLAFKQALASYRDKVELEVAATWDLAQTLRKAAQEPEVAQARLALADRGQLTMEEQVQVGRVVKDCLDRRRRAYRERMAGLLQPLAAGMAPNALLSEEMVMNMAFLVERGREAEFGRAVEWLDHVFKGEIAFRVIGPLPPYSFATVEVERIAPERVAAARQALGLKGTFSAAEVRRAYRRLAAGEQRRESEEKTLSARLAQLKQAADLLASWSGVREKLSGGDSPVALKDGAGLFALRIGGLRSLEIEAARFGGQTLVAL